MTETTERIVPEHPTTALRYKDWPRMQDPRAEKLDSESQAALRQFSIDRVVGYGVDPADAAELHERVLGGERWKPAATELALRCRDWAHVDNLPTSPASKVTFLRRASALLRISQVMMLTDTPDRQSLYHQACELFAEAADIAGDRTRAVFESPLGPVEGWYVSTPGELVGSAIVIGGIEGYAMDFDSIGQALSQRGVEALLLDGPGQGATRFTHGHYFGPNWGTAFSAVIDALELRHPGLPIGIVGNSMGGSIAASFAAQDRRVVACCNNGGIPEPRLVSPAIGTFFSKMATFCGTENMDRVVASWSTVNPLQAGPNTTYSLLSVHGNADPLVTAEMARALLDGAPTSDKRLVTFSDGEHCIYNHRNDRDALIADWISAELGSDRARRAASRVTN